MALTNRESGTKHSPNTETKESSHGIGELSGHMDKVIGKFLLYEDTNFPTINVLFESSTKKEGSSGFAVLVFCLPDTISFLGSPG